MAIKKKIFIPSQDTIQKIDPDDIIYCKADNNYLNINLTDGDVLLHCKSLNKFNKDLGSPNFLRISQSYLVNANYIRTIHKKEKCVILENQTKIPFTIPIKELLNLLQPGEMDEEG